jgi:large subunit ribosomal protein L29
VKIKEIRDLSSDELVQKSKNFVEELFKLRLRHTSGQLESPAMIRSVRKNIARIRTLLREREVRET